MARRYTAKFEISCRHYKGSSHLLRANYPLLQAQFRSDTIKGNYPFADGSVMEPSIKGFAMLPTVQKLRQLRESGQITDSAWYGLAAQDRKHLETLPSLTIWYPVASQGRLLDLLAEVLGGSPFAIVEFARNTATEVLDAPALRVLLGGAGLLGSKLGPTMVRMARFGFSFGEWRFEGDNMSNFRVIADGMEPMPEGIRLNTQGFIDHLASRLVGAEIRCRSSRPTPGRILYECYPVVADEVCSTARR